MKSTNRTAESCGRPVVVGNSEYEKLTKTSVVSAANKDLYNHHNCREDFTRPRFCVDRLRLASGYPGDDAAAVLATVCSISGPSQIAGDQLSIIWAIVRESPDVFSAREWLDRISQTPNMVDVILLKVRKRCVANLRADWQTKALIKEHSEGIGKALSLDLQAATWDRLVDAGMHPLGASFFMMQTRPSERVALHKHVLRWAQESPALIRDGGDIPDSAPTEQEKYETTEMKVRRTQKVAMGPGITSLQAEQLIAAELELQLQP